MIIDWKPLLVLLWQDFELRKGSGFQQNNKINAFGTEWLNCDVCCVVNTELALEIMNEWMKEWTNNKEWMNERINDDFKSEDVKVRPTPNVRLKNSKIEWYIAK